MRRTILISVCAVLMSVGLADPATAGRSTTPDARADVALLDKDTQTWHAGHYRHDLAATRIEYEDGFEVISAVFYAAPRSNDYIPTGFVIAIDSDDDPQPDYFASTDIPGVYKVGETERLCQDDAWFRVTGRLRARHKVVLILGRGCLQGDHKVRARAGFYSRIRDIFGAWDVTDWTDRVHDN